MKSFKTEYSKLLDKKLSIKEKNGYIALDLFAGCGGLSLGFEAQGFKTIGYEQNEDCSETYRANLQSQCFSTFLSTETIYHNTDDVDVVIGGPPCQPFSVGGKQMGIHDSRNSFPIFIKAIKKIKPKIWMFENVKGLLYRNKWYFDTIIDALKSEGYIIEYKLLNAVDYEVPQNRERLFVVGHEGDFSFPFPQENKITTLEALGEFYKYEPEYGKYLTTSMDRYIEKYEIASKCINPRDLHQDKPSRTITCRNLAGATGDMLRIKLPSGKRRRLLPKEAARLQSFPDWFQFKGTEVSAFNQIGNAVPPILAFHLAGSILNYLNNKNEL